MVTAAKPTELQNLAYAINGYKGIHSQAYAKKVWEILVKAEKTGKVKEALAFMKTELEAGRTFW